VDEAKGQRVQPARGPILDEAASSGGVQGIEGVPFPTLYNLKNKRRWFSLRFCNWSGSRGSRPADYAFFPRASTFISILPQGPRGKAPP
jgi:hypothetical protein